MSVYVFAVQDVRVETCAIARVRCYQVRCCCWMLLLWCWRGFCSGAANQGQSRLHSTKCAARNINTLQCPAATTAGPLQSGYPSWRLQQITTPTLLSRASHFRFSTVCLLSSCYRNFKALQNYALTNEARQTEHKEYLSIYLQIPWLYKQWAPITKGCSGIFQTNHSKSLSACAVSIRSEARGEGDYTTSRAQLRSGHWTGKLGFNVLINHTQRKKYTEMRTCFWFV